jgi:hypothetical protein
MLNARQKKGSGMARTIKSDSQWVFHTIDIAAISSDFRFESDDTLSAPIFRVLMHEETVIYTHEFISNSPNVRPIGLLCNVDTPEVNAYIVILPFHNQPIPLPNNHDAQLLFSIYYAQSNHISAWLFFPTQAKYNISPEDMQRYLHKYYSQKEVIDSVKNTMITAKRIYENMMQGITVELEPVENDEEVVKPRIRTRKGLN